MIPLAHCLKSGSLSQSMTNCKFQDGYLVYRCVSGCACVSYLIIYQSQCNPQLPTDSLRSRGTCTCFSRQDFNPISPFISLLVSLLIPVLLLPTRTPRWHVDAAAGAYLIFGLYSPNIHQGTKQYASQLQITLGFICFTLVHSTSLREAALKTYTNIVTEYSRGLANRSLIRCGNLYIPCGSSWTRSPILCHRKSTNYPSAHNVH